MALAGELTQALNQLEKLSTEYGEEISAPRIEAAVIAFRLEDEERFLQYFIILVIGRCIKAIKFLSFFGFIPLLHLYSAVTNDRLLEKYSFAASLLIEFCIVQLQLKFLAFFIFIILLI